MNKLKNKKLQRIVRYIDSSKFKKRNLEKMMKDNASKILIFEKKVSDLQDKVI